MDWDIVAIVAAGLSVFLAVSALLWPREWRPDTVEDVHWKDKELWDLFQEGKNITALQSAVDRRGKHLRTD